MKTLKKHFKPLLVAFLVVVFVVVLILPTNAWYYIGGVTKDGGGIMICKCPRYFLYDCYCAVPEE